jgi:uncharacterized protein YbgA (DUF1722 family)
MSGEAATATPDQTLAAAYLDGFAEVMRRTPTRRSHANVLQHLAGYVSDQLDSDERGELTKMFDQYRPVSARHATAHCAGDVDPPLRP